ncbi:MAG: hypothetical protein KDI51_10505 [Xanthomonadales bacterium]|nr:hypothetical protein [Xanthomonadales bacterium]
MRPFIITFVFVASSCLTMAMPRAAQACDPETGQRTQIVWGLWNGQHLPSTLKPGSDLTFIHLPNSGVLGVRTKPATHLDYLEQGQWRRFNVELVHVEFFDASVDPPAPLRQILMGANTYSSFGEGWLPLVGKEFALQLEKAVCIDTSTVEPTD